MGLKISLEQTQKVEVAGHHITHNLTKLAKAAGIYEILWQPEEYDITKASQLIEPLSAALEDIRHNPDKYKQYEASNGFGTYEGFVAFIEDVLEACDENPNAEVNAYV